MRTTIANRIYIADPTEEVKAWAQENLKFPNPEYIKKERMGFWLGRTPKELRLYEWNGNVLILPFGVCRELMPMLRGTPIVCEFRQDSVIKYGGEEIPLYDYQQEAVRRMIDAKYGILKATTGSGKTQVGIAMIKAIRRRALWLCHTADLLKQSMDRANRYMDPGLIGTITEGKVNVGAGVTFATVQTVSNLELTQYRDYWDVVIVDECFPGNTPIFTVNGFVPIKDISYGDQVLTIRDDGKLAFNTVITRFKQAPHSLVKVILTDGTTVYCTGNHPILTERGYQRADELTNHDAVCCLRTEYGCFKVFSGETIQPNARERTRFLFRKMQEKCKKLLDRRTSGTFATTDDQTEQGKCFKEAQGKESYVQCGNTAEDVKDFTRDWTQAKGTWWKWKRIIRTTTDDAYGVEKLQSDSGICCSNKDSKRKWLSDELQAGYCDSRYEDLHRDRWKFSLFHRKAEARHEEISSTKFVRVDRVEVQEQTGDGTYGGLCKDGYVYNLEVEGNHNYFANGVNVHNCHRVASSATSFTRYEKVLNHLAARHKYGLTATPARSDGLIQATFALLGKVVYEVPEEAVADRVMKVKIRPVETEMEIDDECLNTDGTINYVKLIERITTDEKRDRLIADMIVENRGHSCLILSERLNQLETIMKMLPEDMQAEAAFINGKMTSRKAKEEREQAIEDMRTGKKKYLFSSYNLSKEGLDIPRLDRLFLASPAKFSSIITQSVGRVRRTSEGKETPVVYDFVDIWIGFCRNAYKERCRSYRKMDAVIERGFLK